VRHLPFLFMAFAARAAVADDVTPGESPASPDDAAPNDTAPSDTAPSDAAPDDTAEATPSDEGADTEANAAAETTHESVAPNANTDQASAAPTEAPTTTTTAEEKTPGSDAKPAKGDQGPAKGDKKDNKDDAAMAALLGPGAAGQKAYIFRGSTLTLNGNVTATSLMPTAEPTYNPMVSTGIAVNPVIWFGNTLNITGYLEVNRELTNADLTTYDGELQLSDLFLTLRATNFYTIPFVGVGLSAGLTGTLPTSKFSFGQTMLGALDANVVAIRAFGLFSGLVFGYQARAGKNFHVYTTGENETSLQDSRCLNAQFCGIWASNGVRNVDWTIQNRAFMQLMVFDWAGFWVDGRLIHQFLYPIANRDPRVSFDAADPTGKYGEQHLRHWTAVFTGIFVTPHPATTITVGTSAFAPQLSPSSEYYVPGFNRWTQLYMNLQINMGGVAALLDS